MRSGDLGAAFAHRIGKETQFAAAGDAGILLPERAGGSVTGIGKQFAPTCLLRLIQRQKIFAVHIDFAAHLKNGGRCSGKLFWNSVHLHDVCRDILALAAVAACGSLFQPTALIAQRE